MSVTIPSNYNDILAQIESNNNPTAKASTSSASGLFQFVKSTAISLGLPWGNDPSLPFGGATVSIADQTNAINTLNTQNANVLDKAGIVINNATLYAAHFLGAGVAQDVLANSDGTPISQVVSGAVIKANSFLQGMTVGDFKAWLTKKTGTSPDPLPHSQQSVTS